METQVTKIADTLQSDYNIPIAVNSPHKDAEGNILDDADNVIIDKDGNVVKQDGNGNAILTGDDGEMLVGLMDVPLSQLAPFIKKSMEPIERAPCSPRKNRYASARRGKLRADGSALLRR